MKLHGRAGTVAARLGRLGLVLGVSLVLFACGFEASTSPAATAADIASIPTPVPTTPPLALPPADDTLPTLAQLPVVAAPTTAASDGTQTSEPTPVVTSATDRSAETGMLSISSADRWSDCVLAAAQATDAAVLLDPIAAAAPIDMTSVQLNSFAAATVGCDVVSVNLNLTDLDDHVAAASACLDAWLESSGGGSVFVGLASIGWGQTTPVWAQPHLVGALDACFTGASFAADVMAVVSADPSLGGAFDFGCLSASFDASGTMRGFAQTLANDPVSANLYVSLSDPWVLGCANVGQMVAAAAAADGVGLSASTISCIDSELKSSGAIAQLVAGTADTDAVGIATIACLTDVEAAALLG